VLGCRVLDVVPMFWEGCGALCQGGVSYLLLLCPEGGKLPSLGVMFVFSCTAAL